MRRTWAMLVVLVVLLGARGEASALLAGTYRCTGTLDGVSLFMAITHYNPNGNVQLIRRVRVFDSSGTQYFDTGAVALPVPARGSFAFAVEAPAPIGTLEDVQVLVTWTQAADTAAPIAKTDFVAVSAVNTESVVSIARTGCP